MSHFDWCKDPACKPMVRLLPAAAPQASPSWTAPETCDNCGMPTGCDERGCTLPRLHSGPHRYANVDPAPKASELKAQRGGIVNPESSLKRLAWAYGCSKKDSEDEEMLRALLLAKFAQPKESK